MGVVAFREQVDGMPSGDHLDVPVDVPAPMHPQALVDNSNPE
jgi:hypothetical protein